MIISGTGNRPNKLGGYGMDTFEKLTELAECFILENKPDKVISGGALGWDLALAQACINTKTPFIVAVPCRGQENRWPYDSQKQYKSIINKAEEVHILSEVYSPQCMQFRNIWMVDNSHEVLALWDGSSGGTCNCISYAKSKNKKIHNLWSIWKEIYLTS